MNFLKTINKLANNFYLKAQVLPPGTSQYDNLPVGQPKTNDMNVMSYQEMKNQADYYKFQVEDAIETKKVKGRPGWSNPGSKVIPAMDCIIQQKPLDKTLKDWAKLEINSMYEIFTEAQQAQFNKLVESYSNNKVKL